MSYWLRGYCVEEGLLSRVVGSDDEDLFELLAEDLYDELCETETSQRWEAGRAERLLHDLIAGAGRQGEHGIVLERLIAHLAHEVIDDGHRTRMLLDNAWSPIRSDTLERTVGSLPFPRRFLKGRILSPSDHDVFVISRAELRATASALRAGETELDARERLAALARWMETAASITRPLASRYFERGPRRRAPLETAGAELVMILS